MQGNYYDRTRFMSDHSSSSTNHHRSEHDPIDIDIEDYKDRKKVKKNVVKIFAVFFPPASFNFSCIRIERKNPIRLHIFSCDENNTTNLFLLSLIVSYRCADRCIE